MLDEETRQRTLDDLEGKEWGEPTYTSHLVKECHRLRRVPLKDFGPEELRIMIGQQLALEYLVPLALEVLRTNPWVSGDYYEGDLLQAMLSVPREFWETHPRLAPCFARIKRQAISRAGRAYGRDALRYDRRLLERLEAEVESG